jgi:hypothetical protein
MNSARLREIVDLLLAVESQFEIQNRLNEASSQLSNIVQQPQQVAFQTQFSDSVGQLRDISTQLRGRLQPAQIELIGEIGGKRYFVDDLAALIDEWLRENAVTPAVVQQKVHDLVIQRETYLRQITQLRDSLRDVGIEAIAIKEGEAEIGFLLPRSLFNNDFEELIYELKALDFILRAFSELATGTVEKIQVHQISTSDPQFFFGMNPVTIASIGGAITWALNTWKQVADVRRVRAETRKLSAFTEKEVEEIFDKKIKSTITAAIEAQTKALLADTNTEGGRVFEHGEHIKLALDSILARVERGMTVEIRVLPPPQDSPILTEHPEQVAAFTAIRTIAPNLFFPKPDQNPILPLPAPGPERRS